MVKDSLAKTEPQERLHSLDVLRGFDMFWIIGGGALVAALAEATSWGWASELAQQVHHHVEWSGLHFYDLIFPLFMFISGVAIPYSIASKREKGASQAKLAWKAFRRMVLLVVFGTIYNGALQHGFAGMRAASVLGQIGISYFFAAMAFIFTDSLRPRLFGLAGILGGIAILQLLVPVPGFGAGNLTPDGSINAWIDQLFLPGKLYFETYDPEGVLCIVSATSVTMMGALAGMLLRNTELSPNQKTIRLLIGGAGLAAVALALSPAYPVIKKIWTVPYNLLAAGLSALLLALFYFVIDVKRWRNGTLFFKVIGLNSITIYLGSRLIDFSYPSKFLLGWLATPAGDFGEMILVAGVIVLEWLCLYHLYKNKIFLRV